MRAQAMKIVVSRGPALVLQAQKPGIINHPVKAAIIISCLLAFSIGAEGFRNPPPGSFGLGRAGGRIAHIADASAVAHNPANLVLLESPELQAAPTFIHLQADYRDSAGLTARTREPWKVLPHFFYAMPMDNSKWAWGLGITVPYGLSIIYPRDTKLRYLAPYYNELKTINFNPSVAMRLSDKLSAGVGLDIFYSELRLRQFYPWAVWAPGLGGLPTDPDAELRLKGTGAGVGANLGLTWEPVKGHRLALAVRSPVTVSYDGHLDLSAVSAAGAAAGITPRSRARTHINYPTLVSAGYGIELSPKLRLEADFEWLQFSRFKSLNLDLGNNELLFNALGQNTAFRENWRNTWTLGVAGDWKLNDHWSLLFGYQFYQSPVPDATLSPSIPDANQNALTAGVIWKNRRHSVAFSYGAIFYDTRHIGNNQNPALNGRWGMMVHIFSLGYTYRF